MVPTEGGHFSGDTNNTTEGGPCNVDVFPNMDNQGNMNKDGTPYEL